MITHERLLELLDYNPETGVFVWKRREGTDRAIKIWNSRFAGAVSGTPHDKGYRNIRISRVSYLEHRLAWFYVRGKWPTLHVDHIDGNRSNNAINNLRESTNAENLWNRGMPRTNTSGVKGVSLTKYGWKAQLRANRRQVNIGIYPTKEQAVKAYEAAVKIWHGDFANTGRSA